MAESVFLIGSTVRLMLGPPEAYSQRHHHSPTHVDIARDHWVFLPQNFQPNMPVAFNLQGYADNAIWEMEYTQTNDAVDTAAVIAVYPDVI